MKTEDLEKIGMGKPASRRLLDAVKRRKATLRKKGILDKVSSETQVKSRERPTSKGYDKV